MVLAAQSGNPPFYLFAILAGALGAFMSTLIRLYHYEELPKLVESRGLDRLRRSDLTIYSLVPPVVGALSAAILFIAFAAGLVQGGSFFPNFACGAGSGQCGSFATFIQWLRPGGRNRLCAHPRLVFHRRLRRTPGARQAQGTGGRGLSRNGNIVT